MKNIYLTILSLLVGVVLSYGQNASTCGPVTVTSTGPVASTSPFNGVPTDVYTFGPEGSTDVFGGPCTIDYTNFTIDISSCTGAYDFGAGPDVVIAIVVDGTLINENAAAAFGSPVDIGAELNATGFNPVSSSSTIEIHVGAAEQAGGATCPVTIVADGTLCCATDCAMTCTDVATDDCTGNVWDLNTNYPGPGTTAQPLFGGDGSSSGCQTYSVLADTDGDGYIDQITGDPIEAVAGTMLTNCTEWTATLPDAFFPSFEGILTAAGATACFGANTIAVFDAATCMPAGTVTQPSPGIAGDVTGLTIGTTYVICTTIDYSTATDVNGAPCTPDPSNQLVEFCNEIVEFGTPPCDSVVEPLPAYACSGSDFQITVDQGACTTWADLDDPSIAGGISGYAAVYYVDAAGNFTNCPAGSVGQDLIDQAGDPANGVAGFVFFGETNLAGGGGCAPVDVGFFTNPTCEPIDIPICIVNIDVMNSFVSINGQSCTMMETTVTVYPNVESVEALTGCDNSAYAFVSDGMGNFFDQDGDGLLTAADACGAGAVLGGDPLDPAFDPANMADDCATGDMLPYDFAPNLTYLTDPNYPGCVEPAAGTLSCTCGVVAEPCTAAPDSGPAYACSGSDFQVPLDIAAGCTTDPSFDTFPTGGTGTSGYIAFYYVDATGAFVNCPAGSTATDVLANLNPPAGTAGFAFFGESNVAGGGGCAPVDIGAFVNPTCAPVDIPICLLNGDVDAFIVAFDTDGDGTNDIACDVYETTVTIYPNLEVFVDDTDGCNPSAIAYLSDDGGMTFFDQDGDGLFTVADACAGPAAFDPAPCTDGATLDFDFSADFAFLTDPNYTGITPPCVANLTGTLTCVCDGVACESFNAITVAAGCNVFDICIGYVDVDQDGLSDVGGTDPTGTTMTVDLGAAAGGPFLNDGIFFFDADGDGVSDAVGYCVTYVYDEQGCDPVPYSGLINLLCPDGTPGVLDLSAGGGPVVTLSPDVDIVGAVFGVAGGGAFYPVLTATTTPAVCPTVPGTDGVAAFVEVTSPDGTVCDPVITGEVPTCDTAGGDAATVVQLNPIADPLLSALLGAGTYACTIDETADLSFTCAACDGTCAITPDAATNIVCDDNGTPEDPSDDTFTFDIAVNGSNTAGSGTFNDDQGNVGIAYGTIISYGPFPISGGNITVTYTDVDDAMCTAMMMATAPAPCSTPVGGTCELTVDVQSSCDNLGNEDETDDITTFTVTVTGTGTGATFNASTAEDGGLTTGLAYGTAYTYTIVGTGGITVTFTDVDDSMCTETVIMGSSCTEPDIPTLSQWGLMILALLMMTFGALRIGSVSLSTARKN